jgi:hypothetical protein
MAINLGLQFEALKRSQISRVKTYAGKGAPLKRFPRPVLKKVKKSPT